MSFQKLFIIRHLAVLRGMKYVLGAGKREVNMYMLFSKFLSHIHLFIPSLNYLLVAYYVLSTELGSSKPEWSLHSGASSLTGEADDI